MAFAAKTDFLGLAATGIELRSNSDGASGQNLEVLGSDGSVVANETYGSIKAPTCEYAITKTASLTGKKLGKAYDTAGIYALSSLTVSTSAGGEPTMTATGVQIETNTAKQTVCIYPIDTLSLSPARHASMFGAFTYTASATLALQDCTFTASAEITPATINGTPVASDAVRGKEEVTCTFWTNSNTTSPTVTPTTGWKQTAPWACTGADSSMFSWTATFTKYLSASAS